MHKVLSLPGRYVQGPGVLGEVGPHLALLGSRAYAFGGRTSMAAADAGLRSSCSDAGIRLDTGGFAGVCSWAEIDLHKAAAVQASADLIIGVGGGQALDTGKCVAKALDLPFVSVPTVSATDTPCSGVARVYTDQAEAAERVVLRHGPELVVVDTAIVLNSPLRFTVAGMGDALPTMYEALACVRAGKPNLRGGAATASATAWARLCYEMLIAHGVGAVAAIREGRVTDDLERTVEATALLSCLGFENCGIAAAHGLWLGFTYVEAFRELKLLHGEGVSIFALVHLVLEDQPESTLQEVMSFCRDVGLPLSLREVGLKDGYSDAVNAGVDASCAEGFPIHNCVGIAAFELYVAGV